LIYTSKWVFIRCWYIRQNGYLLCFDIYVKM